MTAFDKGFDEALDTFEEQLGDLYGIEAVAESMQQFIAANKDSGDGVAPTFQQLTLPTSAPITVHPVLPMEESVDLGSYGSYQGWVDELFAAGKAAAGGTAAWLKAIADNYYLVDTAAIIGAAEGQSTLVHAVGTQLDALAGEVAGNLAVHWEGDAKEEFIEWFANASGVVGALMLYADSAQLAAGAAGDAIAATQKRLLEQAEEGSSAATKAVDTWRSDNDVFPFPPGSGYLISQLGSTISDKIDHYTENIPAGGTIVRFALKKGIGKVPYANTVIKGYNFLSTIDQGRNVDPERPPTAAKLSTTMEEALRDIVDDGDLAIDKLGHRVGPIAHEVATEGILKLHRLPRDPRGEYTA